jgi:hypothetical protein
MLSSKASDFLEKQQPLCMLKFANVPLTESVKIPKRSIVGTLLSDF